VEYVQVMAVLVKTVQVYLMVMLKKMYVVLVMMMVMVGVIMATHILNVPMIIVMIPVYTQVRLM
jgi:hypothetical protein